MIGRRGCRAALLCVPLLVAGTASSHAHEGPPYPIVSNQIVGAYDISVWTDPDATDDGTAGGKFWVMLEPRPGAGPVPETTRVTVSVTATDRRQPTIAGQAAADAGSGSRQYIALRLDHEGPYAVTVTIEGPLGSGTVQAAVDATYDLRPPPIAVAIYLIPFVLLGALWSKVLWRRRRARLLRSADRHA
jgi:hypothetical protein